MLLSLTLLLALAPPPGVESASSIHDRAQAAVRAGRLEEATQDYLWLWNESLAHDPAFRGVRTSYVASEIGSLAQRHEPARVAFGGIFDRLDAQVAAGADAATWRDWMRLGETLQHTDRIIAWVREHRDAQGALRLAATPEPGCVPSEVVAGDLVELFLAAGLAAEAGRLTDLEPLVERRLEKLALMREMSDGPEDLVAKAVSYEHSEIGGLYAAALAAGRADQAAVIAETLLSELDDVESRMMLVRGAIDAGAVGPEHERWLAEAQAGAEDGPAAAKDLGKNLAALRRDLDRALDPEAADDELPPREGAFTPISVAEAKTLTAKDDRLLIIDFTATWCGPCKHMDKTTWSDAGVQAWIGEYGLALQVDVDEQPAVKRAFGVAAMPTVVVLRGGEEVGRFLGYRTAKQLLAWLAELANAP